MEKGYSYSVILSAAQDLDPSVASLPQDDNRGLLEIISGRPRQYAKTLPDPTDFIGNFYDVAVTGAT